MQKRVAESGLLASLMLTGCSGPLSTLDPGGPHAAEVAGLWWGMLAFSVVVMLGVYFLWWRAMHRSGEHHSDAVAQGLQNRWVIAGGVALPTVAISVLLVFGIPVGHRMLPIAADGAMSIEIEARQWYWQVHYPDLDVTLIDEIHIPVDTPVNFQIRSEDVIHSFWVPRLGGKVDAIPGRVNQLRLQASEAGSFQGQCAEYCGNGHAFMKFVIHAHDAEAYRDWQQQVSDNSEGRDESQ